mgnify:CR=1 FL=1
MRIAFYAPMKSPSHPRPSGDRRIGRLLIEALQQAGHKVEVFSELRAWEGKGDPGRQGAIRDQAKAETSRILSAINARPEREKPDIWFSYHLYHKAPDWIGPAVSSCLNIPYVVAEASYAPRQKQGNWAAGLEQVELALSQASAIICLNPRDTPALERLGGTRDKLHTLTPFLGRDEIDSKQREASRKELVRLHSLDPEIPWLVSVAMMRNDAKLRSYHALARIAAEIDQPCQLLFIGDGSARQEVEDLFQKIPHSVVFTGQLEHSAILRILVACDLFVWPAVNEAIGMAILEAQACGLPVVAGASGAIPGILIDGESAYLCDAQDDECMAEHVNKLLADPLLRRQFSRNALDNTARNHSLEAAAYTLNRILASCSEFTGKV